MQFQIETAHRPVVMGTRGAVTCGHPLGSMAGIRMLERGGSAVDAIVAMAAAVAVVEPGMSGVGGDGFTLVYDSAKREVFTVNGTGPAPQRATRDQFADGIPARGPRSASVPGSVGGWAAMHKRWGKVSFDEVLAPAISYAMDGFPISHNLAVYLNGTADQFREYPSSSQVFLQFGRDAVDGDLLRQVDLGDSLRSIADSHGESLYRGELAARLSKAVLADGGLVDEESLATFEAEILSPLSAAYRGLTVYEPGPNSSGHVLLQELLMTEQLDVSAWGPLSADLIHHMVEIKKLAFEDRERFTSDPRFVGELPTELFTEGHARTRLAELRPDQARGQLVADAAGSGDTTYLAAADRDGNVASMTTSINMAFGSAYVAGSTGILLNNRMTYWHLDPGHPNTLEPGKRVRHTVSPAILLDGDRPAMAIGTPGSDGQVQTIYQVLINMLEYGMNPQEAVEHPRWRSFVDGQDANWPHSCVNQLQVESRIPSTSIEGLQARGHQVLRLAGWGSIGSVQVIRIDNERGVFAVGSDPRRDAYGLAI
ncbi:MAG: gamma-glutamyltransferase [Chloroflexia bacterium]|nr:gamma-glutamyltransferase [Chloroflexia bacterium]